MASEAGYEVRTGPSAGPGPVLSRPEDFGAGVGQALEQFGAVKHNAAVRAFELERQQKRASEAADFASKFAQYRAGMDTQIAQLRDTAAAGGAGHAEAVKKIYEAGRDALFAGITEDSVRRQAQVQFDESMAAATSRESLWQTGQQVAKLTLDAGTANDTSANRIRTNPEALGEELGTRLKEIAALPVGPDVRDKLGKEYTQQAYDSYFRGLVDRGQAPLAKQLIESGQHDDVLSPQQRGNLLTDAEVQIVRDQRQAEQERAAALAGAKETATTLRDKAAHVPLSESEIEQAKVLRDQFSKIGDTSTAEGLQNVIADNVLARKWQGALPTDMQQRLTELNRKASHTEEERREAAWLPGQIRTRAEAYRADSKSFFIQYGGPQTVPPVLDLADPRSIAATVQWGRKIQTMTGAPVDLLTREQAEALAQQASQGPAKRLEVLSILDRFPDVERDRVAQQMLPGDASFRQEAQLHPEARALVYDGRDVLKGNRAFLTPDKDSGADARALIDIHDREMNFALAAIPAADRNAIKQSSGQWLAGWLSKRSRDVNSLTPWDIRQAATYALGGGFERGTRQKGGIGHWAGGQAYAVPDTMSELDFAHAVDRARQAMEREGRGPTVTLRNAYPVWLGGNRYRWDTQPPGAASPRAVLDAKGDVFIMAIGDGQ